MYSSNEYEQTDIIMKNSPTGRSEGEELSTVQEMQLSKGEYKRLALCISTSDYSGQEEKKKRGGTGMTKRSIQYTGTQIQN